MWVSRREERSCGFSVESARGRWSCLCSRPGVPGRRPVWGLFGKRGSLGIREFSCLELFWFFFCVVWSSAQWSCLVHDKGNGGPGDCLLRVVMFVHYILLWVELISVCNRDLGSVWQYVCDLLSLFNAVLSVSYVSSCIRIVIFLLYYTDICRGIWYCYLGYWLFHHGSQRYGAGRPTLLLAKIRVRAPGFLI
jgi:hypothetical protein